ncbi:MAG: hypothetical protein IKF19_00280 [Bacilli bacterium]|nr:hypothetical protein [Bacilli bacterium]
MSCNVIKEYVEFNKNNFKIYTEKMMDKYFDEEIFNKYADKYVSIRYYNSEPAVRATLEYNLNHYLNQIYEKDKNTISEFILKLFRLYYYIDNVADFDYSKDLPIFVETLNTIREEKVGIKDPNFSKEITELLLSNQKRQVDFINNLNSHEFYLEYKKIPKKETYNIKLKYEIQIPKLYSKFAIRKVWETTMITENKYKIEYYLLNQQILKDMIDGVFNKDYLVDFKNTILKKENILKKTLEIINNDIAKDLITIKINYEDFIYHKDTILSLIKEGYQFALIIDEKYINSNDNKNIIDIFKYIIINNKDYLTETLKQKRNLIILE